MKKQDYIKALERVADIAATCLPDLSDNLKAAHDEYMDSKIARGAYEYVLARHGHLAIALNLAGYTEKHPIFDFPIKPAPPKPEDLKPCENCHGSGSVQDGGTFSQFEECETCDGTGKVKK